MLPYLICGGLVAAGVGLLARTYKDYRLYRRMYGPWDHWTYRGRRISRGQRVYIPETWESVRFTGHCVFIRDRYGHEERYVVRQIGTGNGRG